MSLNIVAGPLAVLAIGAVLMLWLRVHRRSWLDVLIAIVVIAGVQLLINTSYRHAGDIAAGALLVIYVATVAITWRRRPKH